MNKALEKIKEEYKPYRVTKKKSVTIIDSTSGSFVIKSKLNDKLPRYFDYLLSRSFDYFPKLKTSDRDGLNVFEYLDDIEMPKDQKALDLVELVALLHNKTTHYKEVTSDKYKEIYENLKNNILYTKNYYDNLYNMLIEEVIPSPSHYLLMRNIYKIFAALDYCDNELEEWFNNEKETLKERVAFIHNNLEIDHFIRNDKSYLVSWEHAKIDSPILDLIGFYERECLNYDFETLIKVYLKDYPLTDNEKRLFFIVISIPPLIELKGSEFEVVGIVQKKLDYIFKTENLVKVFTNDAEK